MKCGLGFFAKFPRNYTFVLLEFSLFGTFSVMLRINCISVKDWQKTKMRQLHLQYVTLVERELLTFHAQYRPLASFFRLHESAFGENREFRYFTQFVGEKIPNRYISSQKCERSSFPIQIFSTNRGKIITFSIFQFFCGGGGGGGLA